MQVKSYTNLTLDNVDLDKVLTAFSIMFVLYLVIVSSTATALPETLSVIFWPSYVYMHARVNLTIQYLLDLTLFTCLLFV